MTCPKANCNRTCAGRWCLVHGEVEEERVKVIKVEKFEPDPVQGVLAL